MSTVESGFYWTDATLPSGNPSYVERAADSELHAALQRGEFCYVLTSRQMGKSSLMVRTAARLREEGIAVAVLDLTALGQNLSAEQWYLALLGLLGHALDLEDELEAYWEQHARLGPLRRWMQAVREVALPHCPGRIVLFVDEIDAVRSLPFSTDEFFAAIRECYNRRNEDPELARLTFCLLGVATPSDLIQDPRTTPFNIGRRIALSDFTEAEAAPLAAGLQLTDGLDTEKAHCAEAERRDRSVTSSILQRVLHWTGGHPYLTQALCRAVVGAAAFSSDATPNTRPTPALVDRLCAELFLSPAAQAEDHNLLFVRDWLLKNEGDLAGLLELYRQVWRQRRVPVDDTNPFVDRLLLSGIVRAGRDGCLQVRNRIYARVFIGDWATQHMPDAELRRQRAAYRQGLLRAAGIAGAVFAAMAALSGLMILSRQQAIRSRSDAIRSQREANISRLQAETNAREAKQQAAFARTQAAVAAANEMKANQQAARARISAAEAQKQRGIAVAQTQLAQRNASLAVQWARREAQQRQRANGKEGIARDAARTANQAREDAEARRVQLTVANGAQRMDEGDLLGSLPWFAEALRLEERKPSADLHRLRLAAVLEQCPKLLQQYFQTDGVICIEFSPDGQRIVTAGSGGTARIWDTLAGRLITAPIRAGNGLYQARFSPNGHRVVTASSDGAARVWSAATGRQLIPPLRHAGSVRSAQFSPDGRWILTASEDKTARIWDAATGRPRTPPLVHRYGVVAAAFSPDGRYVVTATRQSAGTESGPVDDGQAQVWNAATGQAVTAPLQHAEYLTSAVFSPDARRILTASADGSARIWDVKTGQPAAPPLGHGGAITAAAFSPDGRRVLTGSVDQTARVWDAGTGQPVTPPLSHGGAVLSVAFSPDGQLVATGGLDASARVWDASTGDPLTPPLPAGAAVLSIAFSPEGRRLAVTDEGGVVRIWRVPVDPLHTVSFPHYYWINTARLSPDGKRLVTAGNDDWALWDARTGQPIRAPRVHDGWMTDAEFSPDGRRVVTASQDGTARIWNVVTGQPRLATTLTHAGAVVHAEFSGDGRYVLTASKDKTARVWDATTGRLTHTFQDNRAVHFATFSPDGRRVVTATDDGAAWIWRRGARAAPPLPCQHRDEVNSAAFSPDGSQVVTASSDDTARVWSAMTGKPITPPLQHQGAVYKAVFSPDGRRIATASFDQTARVWDALTGKPITPPLRHRGPVNDAEFSPDGRQLVTASSDGTARIWDAATGQPLTPPLRFVLSLRSASFSPDGRRLLVAGPGGPARIWDLPGAALAAPSMVELAELFSCRQVARDSQGLAALDRRELAQQWARLSTLNLVGPGSAGRAGIDWSRLSPAVRATCDDHRVALSWEPLGSALGYNVYRGPDNAQRSQLVRLNARPVKAASYVDRGPALGNGQALTYAVAALFPDVNGGMIEGGATWLQATPVLAPPGFVGCGIDEGDPAGSVSFDPHTQEIRLRGAGVDIWNSSDQFYFVNQPVSGNFQIIVKAVTKPTGAAYWSKAGLMIRESLDGGARHATVITSFGGELALQYRPDPNSASISAPSVNVDPPLLLRLTRRRDTITAEYSRDNGRSFQRAGDPVTFVPPLPPMVYAGLAICSVNAGTITEAWFGDLVIRKVGK